MLLIPLLLLCRMLAQRSKELSLKYMLTPSYNLYVSWKIKLRQLATVAGKREERKLPSHPIHNPKGQQFRQLKAIMVS